MSTTPPTPGRDPLPPVTCTHPHPEGWMNNLLYIAVVLIVLWIVAGITKFFAGALLHQRFGHTRRG